MNQYGKKWGSTLMSVLTFIGLALGGTVFGWEGEFKLNSGTKDQTTDVTRHTTGWATLAQNSTAVWNMSGDAKAYLTASGMVNQSLHIATTLGSPSSATINILADSPEVKFYSERVYAGTFSPGS